MIKLSNVTKTFSSNSGNVNALKGINLNINKGDIFGIIGLSGAGKSTLIRCINMLEKPTSGSIIVDNDEMTALSSKELLQKRQKISMIFQHFNLLTSRTIYDNIAFPLEIQGLSKDKIKDKVLPLLKLVGLEDRADYYPSQLSGGQKQRVGIARALASDPKVLLCDEATSALDPQTTKSILYLLKNINETLNLTIVLITHEMNVIKEICDKVAVIENGVIVEQGDVFDVFTQPKTEIGKEFVGAITKNELPSIFDKIKIYDKPQPDSHLVIRISFIGDSTKEPILSNAIKTYGINLNIIYGNIDSIKGIPCGTMIVSVIGDNENIQAALTYFQSLNLKIEVIGYVCRDL